MLNQEQINFFHDQGYLVVENVVADSLLADLRQEYLQRLQSLCQQWQQQGLLPDVDTQVDFLELLDSVRAADLEWFQPLDISLPHDNIRADTPFHTGPAVFALLRHPPILDIAESLLGGELTSNPIQHVRIKPPQRQVKSDEARAHIVATDWHQDRGVTLAEADNTDMITVWVAVTDATVDNGCLQVIPQPPKQMLPHCPKSQTAIADNVLETDQALALPVKAGGVVLLHPLTPHCSGINSTKDYRWSFDLRYNISGQPTGRSQFPDFIARSRRDSSQELSDWRQWQRMWEATRTKLANSEHIPQHRWRSDSPFCA